MFGASAKGTFDRNIDKATSQLLLEPDWEATLQICDAIRQKDVTGKYAVGNIRKKLYDKNPRVTLYALQVLESCVKNCGTGIHEEVATPQFMEDMKELVLSSNEAVKGKTLELMQAWAQAFRNEGNLKIVCDTFSQLKGEGHALPQLKESDAMFVAEKAPDWAEGERCYTCRSEFGLVQRQHHCRHCGQVFCSKCSSKNATIPKFGIEKPVRVCDSCHDKLQGKPSAGKSPGSSGGKETDLPDEYLNSPLAQQSQLPPQRNESDLQEEEELQLAMALSLDEAENKHLIKGKSPAASTAPSSAPSPAYNTSVSSAPAPEPELDPELARYLNRSYWEQKQQENRSAMPSAPSGGADIVPATAPPFSQSTSSLPMYSQSKTFEEAQNGAAEPENEELARNMASSIDVLVNRMKSDSSRGRSIASDTTVQGLFQVLSSMHPRLVQLLQEKEEKRAKMEALQDKLAQIRDAREALDALREEHREKLRREAEEAERLRQMQMAHKLEIMRRKKQEMLQFRQQQALMRMQEQERERQIWLEQQKQQQQMRQIQYTAYGMGGGMGQPGMMPQGGMAPPPAGMQHAPPQGQYVPSQQYGSPSHAPYGMAPPQGAYPSGPPPPTTQMDTGQPTIQVGYNQPPSGYQVPLQQQQQQPPPPQQQQQQLPPPQQQQQQPPPYQQPMAGGGGGGYPSGQYGAPSPQQQQQQQPGSMNQNYASPLSSLDYQQQQQPPPPQQQHQQQPPPYQQQQAGNPYNMQAMAGALPPQGQAPPPQAQYGSPAPPPQQQYQPQGPQMMGAGGMQVVPPGVQQQQPPPPSGMQQQPPPQQQREDTLISFE